jgi:hypothetical protein
MSNIGSVSNASLLGSVNYRSYAAQGEGKTGNSASSNSSSKKDGGLGVQVAADGSMKGTLKPGGDGLLVLPGDLKLPAPPPGGVSTRLLSPGQLLVLTAGGDGKVSVQTKGLGISVDEANATFKGSALPQDVCGVKVVDVPVLGPMAAPDPGQTSSYLIAPDRLLSLKTEVDGTVSVDTRTLGLEADKKGNFKGAVLPDPATGKVSIGDKEIDVSGMKPGDTKKKTIRINGKKYKIKLKMNADGSVSVEGKRKRSLFSRVAAFFSGALNLVAKFAPVLALIPGVGTAVALVAKVASTINTVKNFVQSIGSGNWLGAIGSAASAVAGFAQGVVGQVANTVSQVADYGQQVLDTLKYGLGKGLQVVSNGFNLLSGGASLVGANGVAKVAGQVAQHAAIVDSAAHGNLLPAVTHAVNTYVPKIVEDLRRQQQERMQNQGQSGFDGSTAQLNLLGAGLPAGTLSPDAIWLGRLPGENFPVSGTMDTLVASLDVRGNASNKQILNGYFRQIESLPEGRLLTSYVRESDDSWKVSIENIKPFGETDLNRRTIKLNPNARAKTLANEIFGAAVAIQSRQRGTGDAASIAGRHAEAGSTFVAEYLQGRMSGENRGQAIERASTAVYAMMTGGVYGRNLSRVYNPVVDEVVRIITGSSGLAAFREQVENTGFTRVR